ncbi:redox-active disulfide protein 2 [Candidatus Atribacteria bacterium RBG_16_35_8]|nr:MAG: redox-active disulfide protein 2 [Candidatus Atribacteria bacterium RBG_16_35_8]
MKIQILGSGCPKCRQTEANAREAVDNLEIDAVIEKITDINQIIDFGVTVTPALAVDGDIKFSGKIPSVEEIEEILKQ